MVHKTVLTYDDLAKAPADLLRRELLGGELFMSPAPSPLHQQTVGDIYTALRAYAEESGGMAFVAPLDIVFGPDTDRAQVGLRADHVFHRRDEFLGEAAMRDEYQTDHEGSVMKARKIGLYARARKGYVGLPRLIRG